MGLRMHFQAVITSYSIHYTKLYDFGEEQIITQVKNSIYIANEECASDATLNTLFRYAVTCAKKVKTEVVIKTVSPSVASQAVEIVT